MRNIFTGALALSLVAGALAGDTFEGVMTITHGYYTDRDGRMISLVGKQVPFVGEPIALGETQTRQPAYQGLDSVVYNNDHGPGSYIASGFAMPSVLDDVRMVGGAGATWQTMTMAVQANISNANQFFLIRWIGFTTFTPGLGAGVSAFSNPVLDFGGPMNILLADPKAVVPGAFKMTFDISGFNLTFPANQMYFAQQFREWNGNPEAPFRMEFDSVFSKGFPSPGQSNPEFYFDFEPNGIYDETEQDIWPKGNEANLLLTIIANQTGTVETRVPSSFLCQPGVVESGEVSDLWDSDNFYLVARPGIVFSTAQHPLRLELTSTSTTTSPTSVAMIIENKSTSPSIQQQVEFWNYGTSAWVLADTRAMTTTDTTIEVVAPGAGSQFVHGTSRQMRTRLSYRATAPVFSYPWRVSWDQTVWKVTLP